MKIQGTSLLAALSAGAVLAVSAATGGAAAQPAPPSSVTTTPFTTPNTDGCPQQTTPPPPVDSSEVPAPGSTTPKPLSIPTPAVGGSQLAGCGVVLPKGAPAVPQDISSTAWMVSDLDTGAVLAAKDPHGRYRPASTIKVLLAIVALRTLDMDTVVIGTQADADVDGTRVGIGPGGQYTNRQLMQALVLASGNDAAHAIATQLGGDEAAVAKMNELAKSLYLLDTRAATPSGLDGPGMSTSAYDLSAAFREAMTIPLFAELIHTEQVDFPGYPKNPKIPEDKDHPGFVIANDNHLLYNYEGALGGKTGFTDDSRHTFVAAAERDGRRLAVTLLKAEVQPIRPWQQAARLLDYGFALPRGATIGALPSRNSNSADPTAALASPPPKDDAAPAAESGTSSIRTIFLAVGILAILALVLYIHRLTSRRR
ncbi:D-alanyl-D-alanine carboxypeptidase family protein [Nocardia goodfellowii]|uniref:D-alanyl-D-alanine carboxypeptidase (Penicillin-binding protein 5/6) n=1 Tax=Nocardia goodfellowii TaxID=882446 RepID=A0ABS4Q6D0_9NOCA|nr:serine hydrolase [Nocardia goodfellowii]MBP2187252.1 D-alanyl-D-alanine carboxypeptidase (penicillin-binding protein 5/6) [Nocardia goodfellowii]